MKLMVKSLSCRPYIHLKSRTASANSTVGLVLNALQMC